MGSSFSSDQDRSLNNDNITNHQNALQTVNTLLQDDPVDWNLVRQSLRRLPEQACLYAQFAEPSPLHVAVSKGCPVDVAKTLIDAYDDALDHPAPGGLTVLHAAAGSGNGNTTMNNNGDETSKVIRLLTTQRRLMAGVVDKDGLLPLHRCQMSVDGARALIESYPQGVKQRCRSTGSLPLHYALMDEQPNPDLCRLLIQHGLRTHIKGGESSSSSSSSSSLPAGGILTRNKRGQTPLSLLIHHLGSNPSTTVDDENDDDVSPSSNELWDMLLSDWLPLLMDYDSPTAAAISIPNFRESNRGHLRDKPNRTFSNNTCARKLELHTLVENDCCHSKALMDRALGHFRHQAMERDYLGRTPLHIASDVGCTTEALASLIQANPKAPRMTDNEGRLPIDWAAESPHIPPRNLTLLIKGEPRAIDTRDMRDGRYPFLSAAMVEQTNVNNTYYLLRAKPHVLSYFHLP